jgi:hypothetical protein
LLSTTFHDIPEHVAVDGDVAAFDHALLLHVAKLLVLAVSCRLPVVRAPRLRG